MDGLFFAVRVTKSELEVGSYSPRQVRSQEAQVLPQRSIFSLSLSFTDMIEATCHMLFSALLTDNCQHMIREN